MRRHNAKRTAPRFDDERRRYYYFRCKKLELRQVKPQAHIWCNVHENTERNKKLNKNNLHIDIMRKHTKHTTHDTRYCKLIYLL